MNQTPYVKRVSLTRRMEPTQVQRSSTRATNSSAGGDFASLEACLLARPSPSHNRPAINGSRALIRETLALSSQDLNDRRSWVLGCRVSPGVSAPIESSATSVHQTQAPRTAASSPAPLLDPTNLRTSSSYASLSSRALWKDTVSAFTSQLSRSSRPSSAGNASDEASATRLSKQPNEWYPNNSPATSNPHSLGNSPATPTSYEPLIATASNGNPSEQTSSSGSFASGRLKVGAHSSFTLTTDSRGPRNMASSATGRPEGMSALVTLTRDASLPNLFLRPAHPSDNTSRTAPPSPSPDRNASSLLSYMSPSTPPLFPPAPQIPAPMPLSSRAGVYWPRVSEQQKTQSRAPVYSSGDLSQRVAQLLDQSCSAANPEGTTLSDDALPFIFHLAAMLNEINQTGVWSKMALAHELAKVVCRERKGFYTEAPIETQLRRSYIVYETFALALTSVFASPVARHVSCYSTFIHASSVKQWQVPPHIPDGESSLDQVYSFIDFHRTSLTCHFLKATQGSPEYAAHIPHLGKIIEMLVTQGPENAQTALVAFLVASRTYFKLLAAIELPGICDLLLSLLGVNPLIPSSLIATQIVDALERQCFSRYHTSVNRSQSSSTLADERDSSDNSTGPDLRDGSKSDEGRDSHSINFYTAIGLAAKDTIARWRFTPTHKRQLLMKRIPSRRLRQRFLPTDNRRQELPTLPLLSTTMIETLQHLESHLTETPPLSMRRQEWTSWSGDDSTSLLSDEVGDQRCPYGEWKSGGNKHKRRKLQTACPKDVISTCLSDTRKSLPSSHREHTLEVAQDSMARTLPRRRAFSVDAIWLQSDVYPLLITEVQRTFSLDGTPRSSHGSSHCSAPPCNIEDEAKGEPSHSTQKPSSPLQSSAQENCVYHKDLSVRKFRLTPVHTRARCRKRRLYNRCWPQRDPEGNLPSSQRYLIALSRFLLRLLDGSIAILASLPSTQSTDVDDVRPLPSASSDSSEPRHPQLILLQRVFSSSLLDHMSDLLSLSVAQRKGTPKGRDKYGVKRHHGGLLSSRSENIMRRRRHPLQAAAGHSVLGSSSFLVAEAFLTVVSELSQAVASTTFCLSWCLRNKLLQIIPKVETFLQCAVRHICRLPTLSQQCPSRRQALSCQLPLKTTDCVNHILNIFVNLQASEEHLLKHLVLTMPTIRALKVLFVSLRHSWELARIRSGRVLLALIKRLDRVSLAILRSRKFISLLLDRLNLALNGHATYFCCLGPSLDFFLQLLILCQQQDASEVSEILNTYPQWLKLEPALRFKLEERPSNIDPSSMVPLEETRKLRDFRKLEERTERARRQLMEASHNKDTDNWAYDLSERLVSFPRLQSLDLRMPAGAEKGTTVHQPQYGASRSASNEDRRLKAVTHLSLEHLCTSTNQSSVSVENVSACQQNDAVSQQSGSKPSTPPRMITGVIPAPPTLYASTESAHGPTSLLTSIDLTSQASAVPLVTEELSFRARASRSLQLVRQLQQRQ